MRFDYQRDPIKKPAHALGGRLDRPHPVIPITLIGPSGSIYRKAHLDTMADDSVFPEMIAGLVGIDLSAAPVGEAASATGTIMPIRFAQVMLRATDGIEFREWPAWVGFTPAKLHRPLLGFAGCLQFFAATFFGDLEQVELIINSRYPGV